MNRERIEAAIELMKQAKNLYMADWQNTRGLATAYTVEQLHKCGNTACFAGYLAISKEWKEAGGCTAGVSGCPAFNDFESSDAVAAYLGVSFELAAQLVFGEISYGLEGSYSNFYNCLWHEVTPQHVIAKLEMILNGELQ